MAGVRTIEVKEEILADNKKLAEKMRAELRTRQTMMLNLMSSPGSGKTSLILRTIEGLKNQLKIAVIEGDIDSSIDAEKIAAAGVPAVQLRTGGFCHLDAAMVNRGLEVLGEENLDLVIIENIGNLVCPAEYDTGAHKSIMILSIPEGDDKPLKYPLMFSSCEVLLINKIDYLSASDFNLEIFRERALNLNHSMILFEVSCKTGEGIQAWVNWLKAEIKAFKKG